MIQYEDIIKSIYKISHGVIDNPTTNEELFISNEIGSTFRLCSFKLIDLIMGDYTDLHFCIENTCYDIFINIGDKVDQNNKYQVIFCDNYIQIFNFKEGEYDKRRLVSESKVYDHIYSFYDGSIIVVETENKDCKYYPELKI